MSDSSAKPFVAQHAVPAGVTSTRWWWVRHAPVREDGGNIYGQSDIACDCSDKVVFAGVSRNSCRRMRCGMRAISSARIRLLTAIWAAGLNAPAEMIKDKAFAEQDLGEWQGMNRAAFFAARPASIASYWFAPAR